MLGEEFEDLVKAKEEQEEKFERERQRNRDLLESRKQSEQEIIDHMRSIEELGKQIKQTRDHKIEKEGDK